MSPPMSPPDAPTLTLYEEPFSHWCVKARKILDYKRLPYASRRVGYHDKRELLAATGQDYVPALVDGATVVPWPDVPDYLENRAPSPTLHPGGTRALGRVIEDWAHQRLEELVWRTCVPEMEATFEDDLERWVFVEMQTLKRGPLELVRARRAEFEADRDAQLARLEDLLAGRPFLLGDAPGLADFAVYGAVFPLRYAGLALPDRFGRLRDWEERVAGI